MAYCVTNFEAHCRSADTGIAVEFLKLLQIRKQVNRCYVFKSNETKETCMKTIDYFICSLSSSVYKAYLVSHVICSSESKHKVQWNFPG